jgi:hypothetical protein
MGQKDFAEKSRGGGTKMTVIGTGRSGGGSLVLQLDHITLESRHTGRGSNRHKTGGQIIDRGAFRRGAGASRVVGGMRHGREIERRFTRRVDTASYLAFRNVRIRNST